MLSEFLRNGMKEGALGRVNTIHTSLYALPRLLRVYTNHSEHVS